MYSPWSSLLLLALCITSLQAIADVSLPRQQQLMHLLKQDCGSCHGMTLKGGLGPSLLPQTLDGKPDELLVNTVLFGREGTAMPPWQPMLSRPEAVWLVDQLRKGVDGAR